MKRILGIDPGSRKTGYGIIEVSGDTVSWQASGTIKSVNDSLADRLHHIASHLRILVDEHQPDTVAVEQVFVYRNPDSALKLGQARGAAIAAVAAFGIPVFEYAPREIKKAIVGKGSANKQQVQHMVKAILGLHKMPQEDASDALAIAISHAYVSQMNSQLQAALSSIQVNANLALQKSGKRRKTRWTASSITTK